MGRRGPAPTPAAVLKLAGSPLANGRADVPAVPGVPIRPAWLTGRAAEIWGESVAMFSALPGLLSLSDANGLAAACVAQSMVEEYYARFHAESGNMVAQAMTGKVLREWVETSARLWAKFGCSPADRVRGAKAGENSTSTKQGLAKFVRSG